MAIYNIKNGTKTKVAEVNKLESVVVATEAEFLTATGIVGNDKVITLNSTGINAAINNARETAEKYTNNEIDKLSIDMHASEDAIVLAHAGRELAKVGLALARSNVFDFGLYPWNGSAFTGSPQVDLENFTPPTASVTVGTMFLVITYKRDDGKFTRTYTDVTTLVDTNTDTQYMTADNGAVTFYNSNLGGAGNTISVNVTNRLTNSVGIEKVDGTIRFVADTISKNTFDNWPATGNEGRDGLYIVI